jgi:exodeoxyribonuclease III
MILAAWNVNSLNVRLPRLLAWLGAVRPDVVCLQETKLEDHRFPVMELAAAGYAAHYAGQKTYNGVAILVRHGLDASDVTIGIPGFDDPQQRVIAATIAGIRVVGVYVPNGQALDSEKYPYKLAWFKALAAMLQHEMAAHPQLAVLGDFNVAPEDRDVHDPRPNARRSRSCSTPASRTASGSSSSRQPRSRGGTIECWRSPRTAACASTSSCSRRRSPRAARAAASIATRAKARSLPITRRCWSN